MWTSDLNRSLTFYRDVLGAEVVIESPYWCSVRLFGITIGLHPGGEAKDRYGWVVGFQTPDLMALNAHLRSHNADVDDELHSTPRGTLLTFRDPDGNWLQAIQLGLRLDS